MSDTSGSGATPPQSSVIASGAEPPSRFMMGLGADNAPDDGGKADEELLAQFGMNPDGTPKTSIDDSDSSDDDESDPSGDDPADDDDEDLGGEEDDDSGATGEQLDFATQFQTRYGREATDADIQAMFDLAQWSAGLTPDQTSTINQYLSAGYTPKQILDAQTAPTAPPVNTPPEDEELTRLRSLYEENKDDETLGPLFKSALSTREELVTITRDRARIERQNIASAIETESSRFKTEYKLSDADFDNLQGAVIQSQLFPALMQANNGNATVAMRKALEVSYYQDPAFRARTIEAAVESRATKDTEHKARRRRAASVSGTGGNGASRTAKPAAPVTNSRGRLDFPMEAITSELREALNNGQAE